MKGNADEKLAGEIEGNLSASDYLPVVVGQWVLVKGGGGTVSRLCCMLAPAVGNASDSAIDGPGVSS